MNILGISAFYHDSAACLLKDGDIVAAAQEERFTRKKHDPRFPKNAIRCCLEEIGITVQDLDYVVFYDKPFLLSGTYDNTVPNEACGTVMVKAGYTKDIHMVSSIVRPKHGRN